LRGPSSGVFDESTLDDRPQVTLTREPLDVGSVVDRIGGTGEPTGTIER
jgi:hypothetical protein